MSERGDDPRFFEIISAAMTDRTAEEQAMIDDLRRRLAEALNDPSILDHPGGHIIVDDPQSPYVTWDELLTTVLMVSPDSSYIDKVTCALDLVGMLPHGVDLQVALTALDLHCPDYPLAGQDEQALRAEKERLDPRPPREAELKEIISFVMGEHRSTLIQLLQGFGIDREEAYSSSIVFYLRAQIMTALIDEFSDGADVVALAKFQDVAETLSRTHSQIYKARYGTIDGLETAIMAHLDRLIAEVRQLMRAYIADTERILGDDLPETGSEE